MSKTKKQKIRGLKGNYVLNQKFQRFADSRTKRLKTRAARDRLERSLETAAA